MRCRAGVTQAREPVPLGLIIVSRRVPLDLVTALRAEAPLLASWAPTDAHTRGDGQHWCS